MSWPDYAGDRQGDATILGFRRSADDGRCREVEVRVRRLLEELSEDNVPMALLHFVQLHKAISNRGPGSQDSGGRLL